MRNSKKYDKNVEDFIVNKISECCPYKHIYNTLKEEGSFENGFESFKKLALSLKKRFGIIENNQNKLEDIDNKLIKILESNKISTINMLLSNLNCNKKELYKSISNCVRNGYEITKNDGDFVFLSKTNTRETEKISKLSNTEITFGIVSDPHFGSKSCQITALNEFAEIMKKKGVKHIFVPGDLVTGYEVYPGQIHDVYALTAKEQEETTLLNLPKGFDWYILGGNHDYSFIKRGGGFNIVSTIASKRSDIHYLGFDEAIVPILDNTDVLLAHPSGGVPYSISYRLQKSIEQITISELQNVVRGIKEKPTIRFVLLGHLHIQMQSMFGSIWGAQCGTFEGQTNYLKRKGLIPSIGGYVVNASLGKNGLLRNFDSKFYLFDEIQDDWKNYNHSIKSEQKIIKPIFK